MNVTQYDGLSFGAAGSDAEGLADRVERVRRRELPNGVCGLVGAYDEAVGVRDGSLRKWLYLAFPSVTLSCVDSASEETPRLEGSVETNDLGSFLTGTEKTTPHHLATEGLS